MEMETGHVSAAAKSSPPVRFHQAGLESGLMEAGEEQGAGRN